MRKLSDNEKYLNKRKNAVNARTRKAVKKQNEARRIAGLQEVAHVNLTYDEIRETFMKSRGKCAWCGSPLKANHIDHIYPTAKGGRNTADNIVVSCPTCNNLKRTQPASIFIYKHVQRKGVVTPQMRQIAAQCGIPIMVQVSLWSPAEIIVFNPNKRKRGAA
jgi:hypothetical protein